MKDYLNEVNELFPIRRRDSEKADFYNYVRAQLGAERVNKEILDKKHHNIVIGDISRAKVIFTAHYDTPYSSPVPNLMFPTSRVIGTIIHLIYPILLALLSLLVAYLISDALGLDTLYFILIYFVLFYGAFFGLNRTVTNKHNKNDNTSGVATVLSIADAVTDGKAAFVLFDNEEKGLLGSKAFNKKHKSILKDKLIVNFDCVGNGDQMMFIAKPMAEKTTEYGLLKSVISTDDGFEVHHIPVNKALSNSDYKSFLYGVGVMASHRVPVVKFCTGRIHTARDTVADSENVRFLTEGMIKFVEKI